MKNQEHIEIRKEIRKCLGQKLLEFLSTANDQQREEIAAKLAGWNISSFDQMTTTELEAQILAVLDDMANSAK